MVSSGFLHFFHPTGRELVRKTLRRELLKWNETGDVPVPR